MKISSNEFSISVADSVKCKETKIDTYVLISRVDVDSYTG